MISLSILLGVDISVRCGISNCYSGDLVAWFPFFPVLRKRKNRGLLYSPQIELAEHSFQFNGSCPRLFQCLESASASIHVSKTSEMRVLFIYLLHN